MKLVVRESGQFYWRVKERSTETTLFPLRATWPLIGFGV